MGRILPSGRYTSDDSLAALDRQNMAWNRKVDSWTRRILKDLFRIGRKQGSGRRRTANMAAAVKGVKFEDLSRAEQEAALRRGAYPGHKPLQPTVEAALRRRAYPGHKPPQPTVDIKRTGEAPGHKPPQPTVGEALHALEQAEKSVDIKKLREALHAGEIAEQQGALTKERSLDVKRLREALQYLERQAELTKKK